MIDQDTMEERLTQILELEEDFLLVDFISRCRRLEKRCGLIATSSNTLLKMEIWYQCMIENLQSFQESFRCIGLGHTSSRRLWMEV